jgi:hypothetical protein
VNGLAGFAGTDMRHSTTQTMLWRRPAGGAKEGAMPRYFFHLYNDQTVMDEEGVELPDIEAALANGIKEAREIMLDTVLQGRINFSHWIDIADESGAVVRTVSFGEAVAVEG